MSVCWRVVCRPPEPARGWVASASRGPDPGTHASAFTAVWVLWVKHQENCRTGLGGSSASPDLQGPACPSPCASLPGDGPALLLPGEIHPGKRERTPRGSRCHPTRAALAPHPSSGAVETAGDRAALPGALLGPHPEHSAPTEATKQLVDYWLWSREAVGTGLAPHKPGAGNFASPVVDAGSCFPPAVSWVPSSPTLITLHLSTTALGPLSILLPKPVHKPQIRFQVSSWTDV